MPQGGARDIGRVRVGTAGWSIPRPSAPAFAGEGTHLQRYAAVFDAAEVNSSFHRPHRPATYARWAASVPDGFRFAVKLPREITHTRKLVDAGEPLARFIGEAGALGDRLGPVLVQLPPSLAYDDAVAAGFFALLRTRCEGAVVCEPRHRSWFEHDADRLLERMRVGRVAADPALSSRAAVPGGWRGLAYWRLHGSPRVYYSGYAAAFVADVAARLAEAAAGGAEAWCVFDNTASGAAAADALALRRALAEVGGAAKEVPRQRPPGPQRRTVRSDRRQ